MRRMPPSVLPIRHIQRLITVFSLVLSQAEYTDAQRHQLGSRYRPPDAVDAKQRRQQEHVDDLENERPHEGNQRGDQAVSQRGKK